MSLPALKIWNLGKKTKGKRRKVLKKAKDLRKRKESGVENQEYFDIEQEHGLTEENIADAGKEKKSKNCKKEKQVKKKRKKH